MSKLRSLVLVLSLAVAALGLAAGPASAITNGADDGTGHPNVGSMIIRSHRSGNLGQFCSGVLISPTVFLTASHCTIFLDEEGYTTGEVWVTFDPVLDMATVSLLSGHWVTNPAYSQRQNDPHDVAVFILDTPKNDVTLAVLPEAGLFDQMWRDGTLQSQKFTNVGYGTSQKTTGHGPQEFADTNRRMVSTSSFNALTKAFLRLSQNAAKGDGGTCYGDSGGPQFIGTSNTLSSVTTTGDGPCYATNVDYRLDSPGARAFLEDFVTLP